MFSFLPFSEVPIFSISVVTCKKRTAHFGAKLYRLSLFVKNIPYYNFELIQILNPAFETYNFLDLP